MWEYMSLCVCVRICVCLYVCTFSYVNICFCVCVCLWGFVYLYVCVFKSCVCAATCYSFFFSFFSALFAYLLLWLRSSNCIRLNFRVNALVTLYFKRQRISASPLLDLSQVEVINFQGLTAQVCICCLPWKQCLCCFS